MGTSSAHVERNLRPALEAALGDTPVVLVVGPRQAGKTTLCCLAAERRGARILSLDDAATLAAASADPAGFVAALDGAVVLDEIQKAPALLPAIKLAVDRRLEPGRFLLTGSADVLALPRVSESLAGRMEVLTLWPFSQGELAGRREGFIDALFAAAKPDLGATGEARADLVERALRGGFPEAVARGDLERRRAWFRSYVTTMLDRDVRHLANIEGLTDLPRLLTLLAARSASLLNVAELSRSMGLPHTTLTRYLALLERAFLVRRVPAWAGSRARRVVKMPRVWFPDTGLLGHLAGLTSARLADDPTAVGPLVETFVASELAKQLGWSRTRAEILHFRTHAGREVDIVLEADDGRLAGIEVKAAATVGAADFKGLGALREAAGKRFHRGVVLYAGREALPFAADLWALPVNAIWQLGAQPARTGR
ncbi:MAG: ATP-binding protein [Deltaproteobacteria bacterium]|nr:ATP-binding protein [Deltaproteobacteria bacterium]